MHHLSNKNKNRFAWLPPLGNQDSAKGPWIIVDNQTYRYLEQDQEHCRNISISSLLLLAAGVLNIPNTTSSSNTQDIWNSECGRYRVARKKQVSDSSRLFVQHKDDYYTRIELFIDDASVATFHEPVWPHLQSATSTSTERLTVPGDYLDALEASASKPLRQSNSVAKQPAASSKITPRLPDSRLSYGGTH